MGKKKSRAVVKKPPPPRCPTAFDCPKCSHSNCVEVKLKRTMLFAELQCRICKINYKTKINPLMKEV